MLHLTYSSCCRDVIDTGLTMSKLVAHLRSAAAGAMSVRVVVLLDKRTRRQVTFDADYVGAYCPDEFVVGYGIDYGRSCPATDALFTAPGAAVLLCDGVLHQPQLRLLAYTHQLP